MIGEPANSVRRRGYVVVANVDNRGIHRARSLGHNKDAVAVHRVEQRVAVHRHIDVGVPISMNLETLLAERVKAITAVLHACGAHLILVWKSDASAGCLYSAGPFH